MPMKISLTSCSAVHRVLVVFHGLAWDGDIHGLGLELCLEARRHPARRRFSSASSSLARTAFAIWPMTGRSSADSLPICFRTAVSRPFAKHAHAHGIQRGTSPPAAARSASAFALICSVVLSCWALPFLQKEMLQGKEKSPPSERGRKTELPRYHPPFAADTAHSNR